jgi:soluble lytic murein transglycosylase
VAKLKGLDNWRGDLTDADTNIGFGSFYLRHVLDKFDNHVAMAAAGYNAGPHRVTSWLPEQAMDADRWIDTIPYTETRRYVRAVLAYTAIYEWQLTQTPLRLSQKLHPIGGRTTASY